MIQDQPLVPRSLADVRGANARTVPGCLAVAEDNAVNLLRFSGITAMLGRDAATERQLR
ncbi:MAG: hypothetical protein ACT4OL_09495 [Nitrospiraceae bacterium]